MNNGPPVPYFEPPGVVGVVGVDGVFGDCGNELKYVGVFVWIKTKENSFSQR